MNSGWTTSSEREKEKKIGKRFEPGTKHGIYRLHSFFVKIYQGEFDGKWGRKEEKN